jgi:hypothetical protein
VELIWNEAELMDYIQSHPVDTILQEYIAMPHELGILYYRYPDGSGEEVSSVVIRDFLRVKGDGRKTVRRLIAGKIRAWPRRKILFEKFSARLDEILPEGKQLMLEPIGNHNRGTKFLDGNHLINEDLLRVISRIAGAIEGFDYGRFDMKVESYEALYRGTGIRILELNGVNSEPAHIYDPSFRLLDAYRVLARHMRIIQKISLMNHQNGTPYAPFRRFTVDLRAHLYPQLRRK